MSPPGIELDPSSDIQQALNDPNTTLVDIRGLEEIKATGPFNPPSAITNKLSWLNTPGTPQECPLLESFSNVLIRDKTSPVIVYCASGKRADKAKQILKSQGYEIVLNAGGHPKDTSDYK